MNASINYSYPTIDAKIYLKRLLKGRASEMRLLKEQKGLSNIDVKYQYKEINELINCWPSTQTKNDSIVDTFEFLSAVYHRLVMRNQSNPDTKDKVYLLQITSNIS